MSCLVLSRRRLLQAGLGLGAALAVPAARANACEFFGLHLKVVHPWTRATSPEDRVAHVYMVFEDVNQDDRLVGVETPLAEGADLAGAAPRPRVDLAIPAGLRTELGEGGTWLRLTGLTQQLHVGRSYPLRLVFEKSGTVITDLEVDFERDG